LSLWRFTLAVSGVFWGWFADIRGRQNDSVRLLVRKRLAIAGLLVSGLTGGIPYVVPVAVGSMIFFTFLPALALRRFPQIFGHWFRPQLQPELWEGGQGYRYHSGPLLYDSYGSFSNGRVAALVSVATAFTAMLLIRAQQTQTSAGSS